MIKKIVGIIIFMLVGTTVVSATNINIKKDIQQTISGTGFSWKNNIVYSEPILFNWGVDQKQTVASGRGWALIPSWFYAQSFIPTKDKLTAVSLYIFKYNNPPDSVQLTVSIKDNLTHSDLITKILDTSLITFDDRGSWVLFDFDDISINPGSIYYIICSCNGGTEISNYAWFFGNSDLYIKGEPWEKENNTEWITHKQSDPSHEDVDSCFKTYFLKPFDVSNLKNNCKTISLSDNLPHLPFWKLVFQRFPLTFSVLQ